MEFYNLILPEAEKKEIAHTLAYNNLTGRYQLMLTQKDVGELIASRRERLRDLELVELGEGILPRLVECFADSPYLFQESYVQDLDSLQALFYRFKNGRTDEEMLELLRNAYDNICQGSMPLLIQHLEALEQEAQKAGKKVFSYLDCEEDFVDYANGMYEFDELLPVLARVATLYLDDTSLSYNEMRKLMSGVTYSIKAAFDTGAAVAGAKPEAELMYRQGQKILNQRFKEMREQARQLFAVFCDYRCEFVKRTVFYDLQDSFARLDIVRSPHLLEIEPEYPVLADLEGLDGVDRLAAFIAAAKEEWDFLAHFETEAVCSLLERYLPDYRKNLCENICEIVLLQALGCMIADQNPGKLQLDFEDVGAVQRFFDGEDMDGIQRRLEKLVLKMLGEKSGYFVPVCKNFAARIFNGMKNDTLAAVFSVGME